MSNTPGNPGNLQNLLAEFVCLLLLYTVSYSTVTVSDGWMTL